MYIISLLQIHFALSILLRDQNKCSVESLIGNIQEVDCSNRPSLLHKTATMQEFDRKKWSISFVSMGLEEKEPESNVS